MSATRIQGRTEVFADWAWQSLVVTGGCSILLGIVLAVWPDKSVTIAGILYGLVLIATAAVQAVIAFGARIGNPLKALEVASAILALALAASCFGSGESVALLSLWVGMGWTVRGIALAIVAVWSEQFQGAGRLELVGLATMIGGVAVAAIPFVSMTTLSITTGLLVIVLGVSEILLGARLQRGLVEPV
ncbi:DUF308 domain-containing protein [Nocardia yunnanensis]|uniref:DUF308 domain-containing protein n=1 Tax=Nocardia yunnanensis TaxID=2382165 RepID=A0A386ZLA1_9NOCA|nr:DUF308 domain-containing protein [Nocardia yunnanensis]AYF78070.1 DUF308 domain-containing protein [Nocardia yunnanensis]